MAASGIDVQLSIKEIYAVACKKCKARIRSLIKEKISDEMVDKVIGE